MTRIEHLDSDALFGHLAGRRWFAAGADRPRRACVSCVVHADDELELVLVDVQFADVPDRTYVLALGPEGQDAFEHRAAVLRLAELAGIETPCLSVRAITAEQSNSSVVLDESFVLKLYRRIEIGPSPEVELLRTLRDAGFGSTSRLRGVLACKRDLLATTLAVVTDYVPSAGDGWGLAVNSLADDPTWLPERSRRLGEVTGLMHAALAAASDPDIAPREADPDSVARLAAEIDRAIAQLATDSLSNDLSIVGRVDDLRDLVRQLADVGPPGLVLRVHGDYHLGQVLWADSGDWVVIDFDGEPGSSIDERRRRAFALTDIAGMLRSFEYAADAAPLLNGATAPAGWAASCREAFLEGWRSAVDPRTIPVDERGVARLLALLELRKLLYELRYEMAHRPGWVGVPIAAIERMLEVG